MSRKKKKSDKQSDFLTQLNAALWPRKTKANPMEKSVTTKAGVTKTTLHVGGTPSKSYDDSDWWDGYYTKSSKTTTTPKSGTTYSNKQGDIYCLTDSGVLEGPYEVTKTYKDWWNIASVFYPPVDGRMTIPKPRCSFTHGTLKFNACVFTATEDYLKARWGRALHHTDRDWLAAHPFATDDGVPQEYMATCIQGMLEPYGMGVSRMRVRKGSLSAGDAMQVMMNALGVNPFAMIDHQTSNAEAAEKMGMDLETANKLWRFEFHEQALPGCNIVGERGWSDSKGVATGFGGGHARYLAPRATEGQWFVCLQLDDLARIDYLTPIVLPEYVARKGAATLSLSGTKHPNEDKPVAVMYKGTYYSPEEAAHREAADKTTVTVPKTTWEDKHIPTVTKSSDRGFQSVKELLSENSRALPPAVSSETREEFHNDHYIGVSCDVCNIEVPMWELSEGTGICRSCYDSYWEKYKCPGCDESFANGNSPWFIDRDSHTGKTRFQCAYSDCTQIIEVNDDDDSSYPDLCLLAQFCPDMSAEEYLELMEESLEHTFDDATDPNQLTFE